MKDNDEKDLLDDLLKQSDEVEEAEVLKPRPIEQSDETGDSEDGYVRDNKGRFGKGNKGRKPGHSAKTTIQMKEYLMQFTTDIAEDMYDVWEELSAKDKAALFIHIVKFVMPNELDVKENQQITIRLEERTKPKRDDKETN